MRNPVLGEVIGRYRIERELGTGASSRVFEARDVASGESVAVKWLEDSSFAGNLKTEFRLALTLDHRNVSKVHELHMMDGGAYFSMDLVVGERLREYISGRRTEPGFGSLVRDVFYQLAEGLAHVHCSGLVHRDVKPENVLVDSSGRVVLVDLGLAQPIGPHSSHGFSGTPVYAAPERLQGQPATRKSDWFSFGVMLFEALAGEVPGAWDPGAALLAWAMGKRPASGPYVPAEFVEFVELLDRLLEPEPDQRAGQEAVFSFFGAPELVRPLSAFVGRKEELNWLGEHLSESRTVALVGDAGSGKTALVERMLNALPESDVAFRSRCHPRENIPFNAVDGLASTILEYLERRRIDEGLSGKFLRGIFGQGEIPRSRRGARDVADAVVDLLGKVAHRAVLVIDDVQWIDEDSKPVLKDILCAGLELPVVLIARAQITDIVPELRSCVSHHLCLGPLPVDAGRALLQAIDPHLSDEQGDALLGWAQGRPLALEMGARLSERGQSVPTHSMSELLHDSLVEEGPQFQHLLRALAVHEHALELVIVDHLPLTNRRAAFELLDRGVVEFERRGGSYQLRLRHQELADAAQRFLGAPARRELHRCLANAYDSGAPENSEALYRHWKHCGETDLATQACARAASMFEDRLAFQSAAERLRWLIAQGVHVNENRNALARVLGRAGDGREAATVHLQIATQVDSMERHGQLRLAAEHLLRVGDVERGRELLDRVFRAMGLPVRQTKVGQIAAWMRSRVRTPALPESDTASLPDPERSEQIELLWTGGLGLSFVDHFASALHQAEFTELAFRYGNADQVLRALAVEYSYTMFRGGRHAEARATELRKALDDHRCSELRYASAIADVSQAAGDYFAGTFAGARARIARARDAFAEELGPRSWELANCGMFELWLSTEEGDLERAATLAPELFAESISRGDVIYRQCFLRGYSTIGWLAGGNVVELERLLEEAPVGREEFQIAHFLDLISRTQIDFFRGDFEKASARLSSLFGRILRSGLLTLRWPKLVLSILIIQSSIAGRGTGRERRAVRRWLRFLRRQKHPAALPWWKMLSAASGESKTEAEELLRGAEEGFSKLGMGLFARCAHQRRTGHEMMSSEMLAAVGGPEGR